jgi:hypothetical protein
MQNKYLQIFLTYITNWRRLPLAMLMLVCGLFSVKTAHNIGAILPSCIFTLYPVAIIVSHVKQQITTPQSSLFPRYRMPHLIVAGLLLLPALFLTPLMASLPHMDTEPAFTLKLHQPAGGNVPPSTLPYYEEVQLPPTSYSLPYFPVFSLYLALAAWLAWTIYKHSGVMFVITIAGFFANSAPPIHQGLLELVATQFSPAAFFLCVTALIALAALAWSLFHLTEEMPDYSRTNTLTLSGKNVASPLSGAVQPDYQSRWQQFASAPNERLLDRLTFISHPSLIQRIGRWSLAASGARGMWILGIVACVPSVAFSFYAVKDASLALPMLWMFPAMLSFGMVNRRRPLLGFQSLYPYSRASFLKDQAVTLACEWARLWIIFAVTILAGTLVVTGNAPLPALLLNIAFSGVMQFALFAATLWLSRYSSWIIILLTSLFAGLLMPAAIFTKFLTPPILFLIAAVLLVTAAAILYDAYRRWLITDLA